MKTENGLMMKIISLKQNNMNSLKNASYEFPLSLMIEIEYMSDTYYLKANIDGAEITFYNIEDVYKFFYYYQLIKENKK